MSFNKIQEKDFIQINNQEEYLRLNINKSSAPRGMKGGVFNCFILLNFNDS